MDEQPMIRLPFTEHEIKDIEVHDQVSKDIAYAMSDALQEALSEISRLKRHIIEDHHFTEKFIEMESDLKTQASQIVLLRKLLEDISYNFDPEKTLGSPCGPEMLSKINTLLALQTLAHRAREAMIENVQEARDRFYDLSVRHEILHEVITWIAEPDAMINPEIKATLIDFRIRAQDALNRAEAKSTFFLSLPKIPSPRF